ncbi:MAG TPA: hypothetical protein VM840_10645 [Actinomycetota bacterium]|nr:hypothetical protein [Actinomycetota bacterium]
MPNRAAFRTMAVLFVLPALVVVAWGVVGLRDGRVEVGALMLAPVYVACAAGLWAVRRWGRTLALVVSLTNLALATLTVLSAILAGAVPTGGLAFAALNLAIAYALTRPAFALPGEGQ